RAAFVLLDPDAQAVGHDAVRSKPLQHRVIERKMQPTAMDADFRILIAGALAAWLLVDELAETVEEAALGILDAGFEQFVAEAECRELAHAVRQQRDADAEFLEF